MNESSASICLALYTFLDSGRRHNTGATLGVLKHAKEGCHEAVFQYKNQNREKAILVILRMPITCIMSIPRKTSFQSAERASSGAFQQSTSPAP